MKAFCRHFDETFAYQAIDRLAHGRNARLIATGDLRRSQLGAGCKLAGQNVGLHCPVNAIMRDRLGRGHL
jgi:hypothetical protein